MRDVTVVWADGLYFDQSRIESEGLSHPYPQASEVDACKLWLARFAVPTKTIRKRWNSYSLKHAVEHWLKGQDGLTGIASVDRWGRKMHMAYISNGAFIRAAIDLGYRHERCGWHAKSPNAYFNMSVVEWTRRGRRADE